VRIYAYLSSALWIMCLSRISAFSDCGPEENHGVFRS
jgi:hypothetical protein